LVSAHFLVKANRLRMLSVALFSGMLTVGVHISAAQEGELEMDTHKAFNASGPIKIGIHDMVSLLTQEWFLPQAWRIKLRIRNSFLVFGEELV
jgi:hypothetical protein